MNSGDIVFLVGKYMGYRNTASLTAHYTKASELWIQLEGSVYTFI